ARKVRLARRYSGQKGHERSGPRVVSHQFCSALFANNKKPLPILAGKRLTELQRTIRKLNRLPRRRSPPMACICHNPDVARAFPRALEEVILAVCRPASAAFGRRIVPARKDAVQSAPIDPRLPELISKIDRVYHREPNSVSVRREAEIVLQTAL